MIPRSRRWGVMVGSDPPVALEESMQETLEARGAKTWAEYFGMQPHNEAAAKKRAMEIMMNSFRLFAETLLRGWTFLFPIRGFGYIVMSDLYGAFGMKPPWASALDDVLGEVHYHVPSVRLNIDIRREMECYHPWVIQPGPLFQARIFGLERAGVRCPVRRPYKFASDAATADRGGDSPDRATAQEPGP